MPRQAWKPTPSAFFDIDIRWLKRRGLLVPGAANTVEQTLNGRLRGRVVIEAEETGVLLSTGVRCEFVGFAHTDQPFGGRRAWFSCPGCRGRAAILYGSPFRCRECRGLSYASQREPAGHRAIRRAHSFRERLGETGAMIGPFPPRPRYMHHATYHRLWARYIRAERSSCLQLLAAIQPKARTMENAA